MGPRSRSARRDPDGGPDGAATTPPGAGAPATPVPAPAFGLPGMRAWTPTAAGGRALVLGGGGATGIAWMAGLIVGLAEAGLDLRDADTMIGTSAGSVVAANARAGTALEDGFHRLVDGEVKLPAAHFRPVDAGRFLVAQAIPGAPRRGRALVGRAALRADTAPEDLWVAAIGNDLVGRPWPPGRLVITAVDALSGQSVVFDNDSGVPLERAMAASCAVPGVYPPVEINGRRYVDGGVRTVTNADLARGHDRIVVIAPIPYAMRRRDRPWEQLAALGPGIRSKVVAPDAASRHAIGRDVLDLGRAPAAAAAGEAQAARVLERIRDVWT